MFEELVDAGCVLFGIIEREVEIGQTAKLEALENLVADKTHSVLEGFNGALLLLFRAARSDKDARVPAIRSKTDFVDHNGNFQTRIFELAGKHGIDFMSDFFADSFVSVVGSGHGSSFIFYSIVVRSTRRREQRLTSSMCQGSKKKHSVPLQQIDGMIDQHWTEDALGFGQNVLK